MGSTIEPIFFGINLTQYFISKNFKVKCWENQCIAYGVQSGETHRVEALAASILNVLSSSPLLTLEQLIWHLNTDSADQYDRALVDTYVRQLILANIIECNDENAD